MTIYAIENGIDIEKTECERFLGVLLDEKLTFTKHIAKLASKISINSGIIFQNIARTLTFEHWSGW